MKVISNAQTSGSGSGGHTIWNRIKTALTQRNYLWFKDANVTDDSTNLSTNIELITSITEDDFDALPTTADGIYMITDGGAEPLTASGIGWDNVTPNRTATDVQGALESTFILNAQSLIFDGTTAVVSDNRVTANTYTRVYFNAATLENATSYGLTVATSTGAITFTANGEPASGTSFVCDIICENR